jgi:hypothetical protein
VRFAEPHACADAIIERVGRRILLALPLGLGKAEGLFAEYPLGTDLTPVEQRLARGLTRLKQWSTRKPRLALQATRALLSARATASDAEALSRLDLARPTTLKDRLYRALVLRALHTVESEQRP